MGYRITVDTGGTFTDVVLVDPEGRLRCEKAATTPGQIFNGMSEALARIAGDMDLDLAALLADADLLVYATSHATNSILEGKTARTAFITTEGFPDILTLREGGKYEAFNFAMPYPDPYVPRALTFEVPGRMNAEGGEVRALDLDAMREIARRASQLGVEAFAVCLIWSIANPAHELAVGKILAEECPGVPVTLSHALNPVIREYRRASSTAIDASLKPLMERHFGEIGDDLAAAGFTGELLVVTSMGGCLRVDDISRRPIYSVSSGPAMAPIGALSYAESETGDSDIIVCDAGGTSFDVSLIQHGEIKATRDTWLGPVFQGHITGLSSIEVTSIGSGGGSIAWVDPGGLLRVGPRSAGAKPGPACCGYGGTEPTLTDAAAVLGYLDPDYFLGGRMPLDLEAARRAVGTNVAAPLQMSIEEAALGIMRVAEQDMVSAIRGITIKRGVDPRECMVVAGGGAAGLNAVSVARELGCRTVLVPPTAAALSAAGAQFGSIVSEFSESHFVDTREFAYDRVNDVLSRISRRMDRFAEHLRRSLGDETLGTVDKDFAVEARYAYQVWELEVPLTQERFAGSDDVEDLRRRFHEVHLRTFKVNEPGQELECQYWKGRLTAHLPRPELAPLERNGGAAGWPVRHRSVWFASQGAEETACYFAQGLEPGSLLDGPAVVEESTTTIVIPREARATVTPLGGYLVETGSRHGD